MYKYDGENGPIWFNEKKNYIQNLAPGSNKKVKKVCPECGEEKAVKFQDITRSGSSFCQPCSRINKLKQELLGERFGRLLVVGFGEMYVSPTTGKRTTVCKCLCDCGNMTEVQAATLKAGQSNSCGCYHIEVSKNLMLGKTGEAHPMFGRTGEASSMFGRRGSEHPSYNPNITDEQRLERKRNREDPQAAKWRRDVKRRDKCCIVCGSTDNLEAHHIEGYADNPKLRYDISNGITLCHSCHIKDYHSFQRKKKLPTSAGSLNAFINETATEIKKKGKNFITVLEDIFG